MRPAPSACSEYETNIGPAGNRPYKLTKQPGENIGAERSRLEIISRLSIFPLPGLILRRRYIGNLLVEVKPWA